MRGFLLFALLPVVAQAQPLPLVWPDKPDGSLLAMDITTSFGGASLPLDDQHWLLAWCDMRDGRGRLFLQDYDLDNPSAGGPWTTLDSDLGTLPALSSPPSLVTPFMPKLASDGQGGAYVLWQDQRGESTGELLLQRVTPDGQFAWAAPLLVAEQTVVYQPECRDSDRCRNEEDGYRQILSDGNGAWIAWRDPLGGRHASRFLPDGHLAAGFPAEGVALPSNTPLDQLVLDEAGSLLGSSHYHPQALGIGVVFGYRTDGTALYDGGFRRLTPPGTMAQEFVVAPVTQGRMLAYWWTEGAMYAQLFDSQAQPLWEAPTFLDASYQTVRLPTTGVDSEPFSVAYYKSDGWVAQQLDGGGQPLWSPPVRLDPVVDENPGWLTGLSEDDEGIVYTLRDDEVIVQRITPDGQPLWGEGTARLAENDRVRFTWAITGGPDGELRVGWTDTQLGVHRITRRDLSGHSLLDEEQESALPAPPAGFITAEAIGAGAPDQFLLHSGSNIHMERVEGTSGEPQLDGLSRLLATNDYLRPAVLATADGTYLVTNKWLPDVQQSLMRVQLFDADGDSLFSTRWLTPALIGQAQYLEQIHAFLAPAPDGVIVALFQGSTTSETVLQRVDRQGNLLWGDSGVRLGTDEQAVQVFAIAPSSSGVRVLHKARTGTQWALYLQEFDLEGYPRHPDNDGLGLLQSQIAQAWSVDAYLLSMTNGDCLMSVRGNFDASNQLMLARLDMAGNPRWRQLESTGSYEADPLVEDPQGRAWAIRTHEDVPLPYTEVFRLGASQAIEQTWTIPFIENEFVSTSLLRCEGERRVLVQIVIDPTHHLVVAHELLEDGTISQLFRGPLPGAGWTTSFERLAEAPEGDVWLSWSDRRGDSMQYGSQVRLLRLDVLEADTGVDPSPRPARFDLAQNVPNPFNPVTQIRFSLEHAGPVQLEVFNLAGQLVRRLVDGQLSAGSHQLAFDGTDEARVELGSGLYLYRLTTGGDSQTRRMLLMR